MKSMLACIAALVMIGCDSNGAPSVNDPKPSIASAPQITLENSSPDAALKSWWKYIDFRMKEEVDRCNFLKAQGKPKHESLVTKVAVADVRAYLTTMRDECEGDVVKREIDEVKVETDTRAVAVARIYNASPIPPGVTPSVHEEKQRKEGFQYRYLLEKEDSFWKVSQVYEFNRYRSSASDPMWKPLAKEHTPSYPSFLFGVQ
jgi:hypothetical protein